jgi:divinyl protochlorophyllide a 8-vinyl-reductase
MAVLADPAPGRPPADPPVAPPPVPPEEPPGGPAETPPEAPPETPPDVPPEAPPAPPNEIPEAPPSQPPPPAEAGPRVGPNAALQLIEALRDAGGAPLVLRVFEEAGRGGWVDAPPDRMIPQDAAFALFQAVRREVPDRADAILGDAGRRTADYLLAHRIPRLAQRALRLLPPRLAIRLLLAAIARHAWTFAGSARFQAATEGGALGVTLEGNPLATPGCPWHAAVFARLLQACGAPGAQVTHAECEGRGHARCRFEITPA